MNSLSQTSVFEYAENLGNEKITNIIKNTIDPNHGAIYVTENELEDAVYKITHRSFPFKAKFAIIDMIRSGDIKLIYNPKTKLTVGIPFVAFNANGKKSVMVNITNYATVDKAGQVNIDAITLYSLCLGAAFSLSIEQNAISILANGGFVQLYADMIIGVLKRMTNIDQARQERLKFVFSKFMYMQLGYDEVKASQAAKKLITYLDEYALNQLDETIPVDAYKNMESLINAMRDSLTEMSNITFGQVFNKWMRSFGETTAFALEYVPFMVLTFIGVVTNCNSVVNVKFAENTAIKDVTKLKSIFDRIEQVVMANK